MTASKIFYKKVDLRNRTKMTEFLTGHFRYNTMSSWNHSTSYANNLKVFDVIPDELIDKTLNLMNADPDGFYNAINLLTHAWGLENDWQFQAGFNGRSGGYLVMYEGFWETDTFTKSWCPSCGIRTGYTDEKNCRRCGKSNLQNYSTPPKKISLWPGRSIDANYPEYFEDWSIDQLKERVKLVQSFDRLCDDIVAEVIYMCENTNIKERVIKKEVVVKEIEYSN